MAALIAAHLALALCGAPAFAVRDDSDLVAARTELVRRAGASHDASMGAQKGDGELLDSALARKDRGTSCVCLLQRDEKTGAFFADMDHHDLNGRFQRWECTEVCPRWCHHDIFHNFDSSDAQAVGMDDVTLPVVATSCSSGNICSCLQVNATTKAYEDAKGTLKSSDIVKVQTTNESLKQCYQQCECTNGNEGLCVDPWSWSTFLSWDYGCDFGVERVGLRSCSLTQQFQLNQDLGSDDDRGSNAFSVALDSAQDDFGKTYRFDHEVLRWKARTYDEWDVEVVDIEGEINGCWQVGPAERPQKHPDWILKQANQDGSGPTKGGEYFHVEGKVKGSTWEARQRKSYDSFPLKYHISGDEDANSAEDFEFLFYADAKKTHFAGRLKRKEGRCMLEVQPREDGGLMIIVSVLIFKAFTES